MLHYPIPNKHCGVGVQLQQDIVLVMEKALYHLQRKLNASNSFASLRLLRSSVNGFLECTLLITKSHVFMKDQCEKILIFAETLKYSVQKKQNQIYS